MQGFNMGKYVPPDQEGVISGNALNKKHALGARASKLSQGILTIRFEMPYPIWCTTCPKPTIIGQGVRFNAQKSKVGMYYSTPIYSFRMKHASCGGWIEIRTDPKNTAYVIHEGARKRDTGEEVVRDGDTVIESTEEREARRADAFASLEGKVDDREVASKGKLRIEELHAAQERHWEDPYTQNKKLRDAFRVGRKEREKAAGVTGRLKDKMSLGIELLPESGEDAERAKYVEFGVEDPGSALAKAVSRPLFPVEEAAAGNGKPKKGNKLKAEQVAEMRRATLVKEIQGNTRSKMDPFLNGKGSISTLRAPPGVKRKRLVEETANEAEDQAPENSKLGPLGLVDYDSD